MLYQLSYFRMNLFCKDSCFRPTAKTFSRKERIKPPCDVFFHCLPAGPLQKPVCWKPPDLRPFVCVFASVPGKQVCRPKRKSKRSLTASRFSSKELFRGRRWIRTTEGVSQQIYSLPHLATLVSARKINCSKQRICPRKGHFGRQR